MQQFLLTSITRVEVLVCAGECAHGQGAVPPKSFWRGQDTALSSARFLEMILRRPSWLRSTEETLGSAVLEAGAAEKFPAQRELRWLRAFLRCVKVWARVGGLGLNLSQKCSWIQVCIPSGSCLQLGKKNLSCGGRVVSHPPSLQCFP